MRNHAVNHPIAQASTAPISAIVTICSNQKRFKPALESTPAALLPASQKQLAAQWLQMIGEASPAAPSIGLYGGRAFGLARDVASSTGTKLFVISAGLGLVAETKTLPAYSITVAHRDADSVRGKVVGSFSPAAWFDDLLDGPYSVKWPDVFSGQAGRVLVALTKPYAEMVGPALARLPTSSLSRLRLFGAGLGSVLPIELHPHLLPYDDRLDNIIPGTRSDFAQRALVHFVQDVSTGDRDCVADAMSVREALAETAAPVRPARQVATDEVLLALIRARLHPHASASRLLRQLRDEDQMACEQGRFAKLFRQAQTESALHDAP
jgi:hypothetical protein